MGVRGFPKVEGVNGNNNSLFPVVSGLVREFFDMLGDGEASPKSTIMICLFSPTCSPQSFEAGTGSNETC